MTHIELRDIPGWEGYYQASSDGHIFSVRRQLYLKESGGDDYHMVTLQVKNIYRCEYVHRLVAMAFIPNPDPEKYTDVNHIDEIKYHNYPNNLEWCSRKYNINYGTALKRRSRAIYCEETDTTYDSINQAARVLNLHVGNISAVCNGINKTTGGYHFQFVS